MRLILSTAVSLELRMGLLTFDTSGDATQQGTPKKQGDTHDSAALSMTFRMPGRVLACFLAQRSGGCQKPVCSCGRWLQP